LVNCRSSTSATVVEPATAKQTQWNTPHAVATAVPRVIVAVSSQADSAIITIIIAMIATREVVATLATEMPSATPIPMVVTRTVRVNGVRSRPIDSVVA